jgi:hypothetical protein
MDTDMHPNGQVRVPFGDDPSDTLTLEHTTRLLRLLADRHRPMFAALLGEAITGTRPKAARGQA